MGRSGSVGLCYRLVMTAAWSTVVAMLLIGTAAGAVCTRELVLMARHIRPCTDAVAAMRAAAEDATLALETDDTETLAAAQAQIEVHLPGAVMLCMAPFTHVTTMVVLLMVCCVAFATAAIVLSFAVMLRAAPPPAKPKKS